MLDLYLLNSDKGTQGMPHHLPHLKSFVSMLRINGWILQHRKKTVLPMLALVVGMVCSMALATLTPAIAQSKTLTLEEISQKLGRVRGLSKEDGSAAGSPA